MMKMTLKDAQYCLQATQLQCETCKYYNQKEIECRKEAEEIAISAINYMLVGKALADEINTKER